MLGFIQSGFMMLGFIQSGFMMLGSYSKDS